MLITGGRRSASWDVKVYRCYRVLQPGGSLGVQVSSAGDHLWPCLPILAVARAWQKREELKIWFRSSLGPLSSSESRIVSAGKSGKRSQSEDSLPCRRILVHLPLYVHTLVSLSIMVGVITMSYELHGTNQSLKSGIYKPNPSHPLPSTLGTYMALPTSSPPCTRSP